MVSRAPAILNPTFSQKQNNPALGKIRYLWKLIEGQLSWATAPVLLLVFTRLPILLAEMQGNTDVLVQNAPFVIENILRVAMVGMLVSAYFNIKLLPGPPPEKPWFKYAAVILQWVLLPITLIFLALYLPLMRS